MSDTVLDVTSPEQLTTVQAMRALVMENMRRAPRSNQAEIGSSEVGAPCDRKIAHRLAFGKSGNVDPGSFRPQVGTWAHAGIGELFVGPRWLKDVRVEVPVRGTIDLYDVTTRTVVDFKFQGVTSLKNARAGKFSETYRVQLDCYGAGMRALGMPVDKVALWCLPSGGSLDDAVYAEWDHDPRRAWVAKLRVESLRYDIERGDPEMIVRAQAVADDYCGASCGAFAAGMCRGYAIESNGGEPVAGTLGLTIEA